MNDAPKEPNLNVGTHAWATIGARLIPVALGLATSLTLGGCSQQSYSMPPSNLAFAQQVKYAKGVDVLWVLDDSGSMSPRQAMLAAQVPDFVMALNNSGLDYQMAVTTMDMSVTGERGKFLAQAGTPTILNAGTPNLNAVLSARLQPGGNGSPVERGEESMQAALNLSQQASGNQGFLRPNALLVVIFLSDEDDSSAAVDYKTYLDQVRPPLASGERSWISNFMGIVPNDPECKTSTWNFTDPGLKYIQLATDSGGTSESICSGDLRQALTNVRARILEVVTEYHLDRDPMVSSITVVVNGQSVATDATNGWTYDAAKNAVVFHGTAIPVAGSTINVNFSPAGEK